MTAVRTHLAVLAVLLAVLPPDTRAAAPETGATQTTESFYAVLVAAMKQPAFEDRRKLLDPEIRRDFDLPLMTRLVVGPPWRSITPPQQAELVEAFSAFSIATYANEFRDFSGQRFVVAPATTPGPGGDVIVHTQLIPPDGEPVQLDYLMRRGSERWQVIDVYLTGTISQLAARRSEFSTVLRQGGAAALITSLREKTATLEH